MKTWKQKLSKTLSKSQKFSSNNERNSFLTRIRRIMSTEIRHYLIIWLQIRFLKIFSEFDSKNYFKNVHWIRIICKNCISGHFNPKVIDFRTDISFDKYLKRNSISESILNFIIIAIFCPLESTENIVRNTVF